MSSGEYFTLILNGDGHIHVWGNNDYVLFQGLNLADKQWHTVIVTYNGHGMISLYVDGIFIQSYTTFISGKPIVYKTQGDSNSWLGTDNLGDNYIGALKNIAYYNYALTPHEAAKIHNSIG